MTICRQNIRVFRGDSLKVFIAETASDGTPIDLTSGRTFIRYTVREYWHSDDSEALITKEIGNGLTVVSGGLDLMLSPGRYGPPAGHLLPRAAGHRWRRRRDGVHWRLRGPPQPANAEDHAAAGGSHRPDTPTADGGLGGSMDAAMTDALMNSMMARVLATVEETCRRFIELSSAG